MCKDSVKRLIMATTGVLSAYQTLKIRKRKPFNPMLGETYELVMENFRFICEKVQHQPTQIVAFNMEGRGFKIWGYNKPAPKFKFNGGKGMIEIH
jgi:hypothetical protein